VFLFPSQLELSASFKLERVAGVQTEDIFVTFIDFFRIRRS
jgi:hypothetical protein